MAEKLPVIIDNRGENKVLNAFKRLLPNLQRMDIATGVFEVGSFLLLEGLWQDLERIRILMGDETTRRTKREIVKALLQASNDSIEREKEHDNALRRVMADLLSDHTELFKQFSDNQSFKKWLSDTIFGLTYRSEKRKGA